jgi:hypothetical protein
VQRSETKAVDSDVLVDPEGRETLILPPTAKEFHGA